MGGSHFFIRAYKYHIMNTSGSLFADLLQKFSFVFANDQTLPYRTVCRTGKKRMCGSADVATYNTVNNTSAPRMCELSSVRICNFVC